MSILSKIQIKEQRFNLVKIFFISRPRVIKMSKKSPLGAHLTKNLRRAPLFDGTLTAYNSG